MRTSGKVGIAILSVMFAVAELYLLSHPYLSRSLAMEFGVPDWLLEVVLVPAYTTCVLWLAHREAEGSV